MTKQKSFKRRIRSRMEKTSESYTAARRQLLAKATTGVASQPSPHLEPEAESRPQAPAQAEMAPAADTRPSDEAIVEKTGRDWEAWFSLLDGWNATSRPHPEIARWLSAEHGVPGWWAQSITVGYERARGWRVTGQGRDGKYSISTSRTINVPVESLFAAAADPSLRRRWLPEGRLEVTSTNPPKSVRGRWDGGQSRVAIGFTAKGDGKSQIGLAHEQLPDAGAASEAKEFWVQRLKELKELLETRPEP